MKTYSKAFAIPLMTIIRVVFDESQILDQQTM